ncbi:MAG TPA: hypothetical protein ENJ18_00965 [Nannocystis exedens]|nr:hypothetical protein [Nannocystis exedens]
MPRFRTSSRDKILLVEGKDDREVIYQFCNKCRIDNRELFDLRDKDGIESLIATLKLQVKTHNLKVLAAVIDADSNLQERWEQLQNALAHEGYTLPNKPATAGTICEPSRLGRPRLAPVDHAR